MEQRGDPEEPAAPGLAIEGATDIRRELDHVDLGRSSLFIEELHGEPEPPGTGHRRGDPDDEDLVDEIVAAVERGHGHVFHVPKGTLPDVGAVLVVDDDPSAAEGSA